METANEKIAFFYDDDAYVEKAPPAAGGASKGVAGPMGRQVAGKDFLNAYLGHGQSDRLVALVRNRASAQSLVALCRSHPSSRGRTLRVEIVGEAEFHRRFFPDPPAPLLHLPQPLAPKYAWARQHGGPSAFALSGVTHTLCSEGAIHHLCNLVTAPYEPFDALICTSRAVDRMVRTVTGTYADYLRDRFGGDPAVRVRLETIPLGVDTERFRPPSPGQRAAERRRLEIADDEVMILYVGRLTFSGKMHPYPMFVAAARAAEATGKRVHLVLAGWARLEKIKEAMLQGAREFAPGVRISLVDGTKPEIRSGVWHAADVFSSLADSIQETFGLTIVEAMASGLPVVASDWDGYRDTVVHGETGYLVPTTMVMDATRDATSRFLVGESSYDEFAAECVQTVGVDIAATAEAYVRLIDDPPLRRRMGEAGSRRATEHYAWPRIVAAYEDLWRSQQAELLEYNARAATPRGTGRGPALYPAPEVSFAGYPTRLLRGDDRVEAVGDAGPRLDRLLSTVMTSFEVPRGTRVTDASLIRAVMTAATTPSPILELESVFREAGVPPGVGRATLAWMLKYGLLRPSSPPDPFST